MIEFDELQRRLIKLKEEKSLRKIAEEYYDNEVSFGVIHRCIKGIPPRDNDIRRRLGLSIIVEQCKDPITGQFVEKDI